MSRVSIENLARKVASRYFSAAFNMDAFARASFLEGVAGVTPGSWIKKKERGFMDAQEWASSQGGLLNPLWTTTRDIGFYNYLVQALKSFLSRVPGIDAEDIAQEVILESSQPTGASRRKVYYSAGQTIGKDPGKRARFLEGKLTPADVKGLAAASAKNVAMDEMKRLQNRMLVLDNSRDEDSQRPESAVTFDIDDPNVRENALLHLLGNPDEVAGGGKLRSIIFSSIDREFSNAPTVKKVFRAFFEELFSGKADSSIPQSESDMKKNPDGAYRSVMRSMSGLLARKLDMNHGQVSRTLGDSAANVSKFLEEKIATNPQVKAIIQNYLDEMRYTEQAIHRVGSKANILDLFYALPKYESDLPTAQRPRETWDVMRKYLTPQQEADLINRVARKMRR